MKVRFSSLFLDCAALKVASTDSICYCLDVLHLSFESSAAVSFWQLSYREVDRQSSGSYMAARIMQPCRLEKLFILGLVKNIPRRKLSLLL